MQRLNGSCVQTWPLFITIKTVKINRAPDIVKNPALGPSPAAPEVGLSPAVSAVLEHLSAQDEPVTIGALSARTGLHGNTVREHLDTLIEAGCASKEAAPSEGRGRPAWLYRATEGVGAPATSESAGLAAALAAHIHRTSNEPRSDGIAAGLDWGRELAEDFAASGRGDGSADPGSGAGALAEHDVDAREKTLALLADLGFDPTTPGSAPGETSESTPGTADTNDADSADPVHVRLRRCPLLSAAQRYPDIVCGVHLGMVRGALDVFGGKTAEAELEPFAEPGACRLHLSAPPEPMRKRPQQTSNPRTH